MRFIEKFFRNELAIDLGTVNTLIYQPGKGILLNEPSVVAVDRYDGEVVCVGHRALKLLGREPRGIEVHRPIHSGTIYNFEVTRKMLRTFIGKVTDGVRFGHFVVGIPGSATAVEQRSVRDAVAISAALGIESAMINGPVKMLFRRERPIAENQRPHTLRIPRTSSFPSGHATSGFCAAVLLGTRAARWKRPFYFLLAAVVAHSRIHVRIHHASDVVAGAAIGTLFGSALRSLMFRR